MNLAMFREKGSDNNAYEVQKLVDAQDYNIDVRNFMLRELGGF